MTGLSWLNSDNSTPKGTWVSNPTHRSTWQIYQSCVITIGLCVWQAVHMNIPPPSERPYKQPFRRVGFVILALIAPEVVALNAWAQLREAKRLCDMVNHALAPKEDRPSNEQRSTIMGHRKQLSHYAILTKLVLGPALMLDKLRMLLWHNLSLQNAKRTRKGNLAGQTNADEASSQLWTLTTAFYALSGGLIISHRDSGLAHLTLSPKMIDRLCDQDPECLRHIREPEIVDRSKVSWIAKAIVCGQSLWFCSQCISRVLMDSAITLLELNTFIHCISACCIYLFWWYKPYDVTSHTIITSSICEYEARMSFQRRREWFPWLPLEFNVFSRKATIALRDPENNTHQRFMTHDLIPYEGRDVRILSQDTLDGARKAQTFNTWGLSLTSSRSFKQMHDNSLKVFVGENIPDTGFSVQSDASTDQHGYILLSPRSLEDWKYLWEQHQRSDDLRQYAEDTFDDRIGLLLQKRRQNINLRAFRHRDLLYSLATFTAYGAVHLGAWNYKFTTTEEGQVWRACAVYTTAFMPALLGIWGVLLLLAQGRIAITAWRKRRRERHPCKTKAWPGSTTPSVSTSKDADSNPCDTSSVYPSEALQDEEPTSPLSHHRFLPSLSFVRNALTHKGILPLCILLAYPLVLAEILSRAFLVVESFIAVPNSQRGVYAVVPWSSYVPHLS
ncbi:hypothetical protein KC360_g7835 [Hortaea werneckii]|nr:hypothetical protein KC325_g7846 [Hortaea werneckii]KAI6987666.1 hypothetical protein KC359_g8143 [Hortaea werneckii]KAI7141706.1 hypothetical protein KC344_g7787 [Hortaea werneckii]KAI7168798.1 hypothetical protein KC360_g7835 [Hortaea werneckii]